MADWQLLLVGAGPEKSMLRRLADELPPDRVRMYGPVESGSEAMAAADVIGLTSRGGDSMPAVLIEAGMMGIPAVATPIEGIVDVVLDRQTGRIVPVDNPEATAAAIRDVWVNRDALGRAAYEHCQSNFHIDEVAAKWHAVLLEVASVRP